MKRVTGIGGIFFKSNDPEKMKAWYGKHLGLPVTEWGATFSWKEAGESGKQRHTVWTPFPADSEYFAPSEKSCMFNYIVEDLDALLAVLATEGVQIVGEVETYEYGKFGWVLDPEGNKIELWQPMGGF